MVTLRTIVDERDARACFAAAASAGETLQIWARRERVDGRSLHAWHRKLAKRSNALVELVPSTTPAVRADRRYVVHVREPSIELGDDFDAEPDPRRDLRVLTLSPTVRVFFVIAPLDMRGSFDALAGAVRHLGLEPTDGHLYLFLNKRRRIAKAIWFDGSGWCLLSKRLETGSFQLPAFDGTEAQVPIDGVAFASLLPGLDFTAARRGWFRRPPSGKGIDTDRDP